MIDVKTCRLKTTPDHIDSVDDVAGYAVCYEECIPPKMPGNIVIDLTGKE